MPVSGLLHNFQLPSSKSWSSSDTPTPFSFKNLVSPNCHIVQSWILIKLLFLEEKCAGEKQTAAAGRIMHSYSHSTPFLKENTIQFYSDIVTPQKFDNSDQLHKLTRMKKNLWLCRDHRQQSSMIVLSTKMSTDTATTEADLESPSQDKATPCVPHHREFLLSQHLPNTMGLQWLVLGAIHFHQADSGLIKNTHTHTHTI